MSICSELAAAAAADQHLALRRVFDRVGHQVLQQPQQHRLVRLDRLRRQHEGQLEAFCARDRRELDLQGALQIGDAEARQRRFQRAGIEPRDVEQGAEQLLDLVERAVDIADKARVFTADLALDQARDVEPRRIQRLQQVVTRGGEEAGLRQVGFVRLALGARELGVQPCQLLGALAHPPLQRRVGALQRFRRLDALGDVGEGDDDAVRHPVGAHLDHEVAIREPLLMRRALGGVGGKPHCDKAFVVARRMRHLRLDGFEDFLERDADLHDPRRQVEDLAELAVRADQLVLAVEDGDALAHVIERGLQDLLVVVQRRVRIVEQLQRRLARDRPLAQQQRQHEPRRGDADG